MSRLMAVVVVIFSGAGCYHHRPVGGHKLGPPAARSEMVTIPSGVFTRGDLNGEPSEYPERKIAVSAFRIDRYEASNADYRICVQQGACDATPYLDDKILGEDALPAVGLSWFDASRYCAWLGRRLPTEAEWEYAAKGTDDRRFPWSGPFDASRANTGRSDPYRSTAPVVALVDGESPFGVRNMAGNAAEWVGDYFDPLYYRKPEDATDPAGPEQGRERVVRGGSYRDAPYSVRVAARRAQSPTEVDNTVGVRCAQSPTGP
ncbi:MAG: SUMF1/EgtB/PvdO family nonheme iron enzyme [Myxococcota bacterium]